MKTTLTTLAREADFSQRMLNREKYRLVIAAVAEEIWKRATKAKP